LGVTPPTVTHHVTKLREAGLIKEHRDKNTIYFRLEEKALRMYSQAVIDIVCKEERTGEEKTMSIPEPEKAAVIQNFFTADGRLKQIPAQRKKKLIVFEHIVKGLEKSRKYSEQEINEHIRRFHDDYATIRREFIMNHFMYRENGFYQLNPPEMWATID
jgi:hypothetical protein